MRRYQILLAGAAVYNLAFGLWATLFPLAFFRWFDLEPPRYPSIWACLGMVIGLYGIGYGYAARWPDRGDVIVLIGLAGKIFGPIGWLIAVARHEFPARTFGLVLGNDLVWWFPFLFYLLRRVPQRRRVIARLCAVLHLTACVGLLASAGGTEMQSDVVQRAAWVREWSPVWIATWLIWSLSSLSLLAVLVVWSERLVELGVNRSVVLVCCFVCAAGLVFDLSGEVINIAWLTRDDLTTQQFERGASLYALLGAGVANGLYCVAGLSLSMAAWRVNQLRGLVGAAGVAMWLLGFLLTVATVMQWRLGMIGSGAGVMVLFIPWVIGLGSRLS
jgi:hypothetical protein